MGVVSSFSQREILREREEVEDTATSKVVACPYTEVQEESFFFCHLRMTVRIHRFTLHEPRAEPGGVSLALKLAY